MCPNRLSGLWPTKTVKTVEKYQVWLNTPLKQGVKEIRMAKCSNFEMRPFGCIPLKRARSAEHRLGTNGRIPANPAEAVLGAPDFLAGQSLDPASICDCNALVRFCAAFNC